MSGAGSRLTLAAFAYDWVGGDIHGLAALAADCQQVAPKITGADTALNHQVARIAADGGWSGAAADAFTTAWDRDSKAGQQLAGVWGRIGAITGQLAATLAGLENELETAARQAGSQGVAIDPATGDIAPTIGPAPVGAAAVRAAAACDQAAARYASTRATILRDAKDARAVAAGELQALTEAMLPPAHARDWGQGVAFLDGLRSLWATPTVYRAGLQKELPALTAAVQRTQRAAWQELIAARKTLGNAARLSRGTLDEAAAARLAEDQMSGKVGTALGLETTGTKVAAGDAAALADSAAGLGGLVRAVPYVGTAVATGVTIYQDVQQHQSWQHAAADGVVSNGAALGGAVAATELTGAILGGSMVSVGVGAVAGGIAAVGVGDFVHHMFQQNWSADWHHYGVLDGTGHAIATSAGQTGHDMAHFASDIWHAVF